MKVIKTWGRNNNWKIWKLNNCWLIISILVLINLSFAAIWIQFYLIYPECFILHPLIQGTMICLLSIFFQKSNILNQYIRSILSNSGISDRICNSRSNVWFKCVLRQINYSSLIQCVEQRKWNIYFWYLPQSLLFNPSKLRMCQSLCLAQCWWKGDQRIQWKSCRRRI